MNEVLKPLSDGERLRFEQCREVVRRNLKTCFEVGAALLEIRESKLYREHWTSFEKFCQAEFNIGKSHAYRLIDASGVKKTVETSPIGDAVQSESHARALKDVPVELRTEVLEAAAAACEGGEPTADAIREAAKTIAPPKPIIELDSTGFAIPEKLVAFWNRREEVRKTLHSLSLVRSTLRKAQEEDDLLYRPVTGIGREQTWQSVITALDRAFANIELAVPYAVCPVCQGRLLKQCTTCQERGFVSEFFYNNVFASDARRVREAACRKDK